MASLNDVARLAGVSKSTVSRVINQEYGVKPATIEKVNRAIEQCGYVVNQIAKDLKSNKTNLIGVIVPRVSSNAMSASVDGLSHVFDKKGKNVLLANTRQDDQRICYYLDLFNQKRVEGILLFASTLNPDLVHAIKRSSAPVVVIGQDGSPYNIPSVIHDDYRVGFCAGEQLINAGCRQVGFLGVQAEDIAVDQQRYQGFESALTTLTQTVPLFHYQGQFSIQSGYVAMTAMLEQYPDLDGVFCATDRIAIGAIQALQAQGITPGHTVKLMGVGDDELAQVVSPSLSTFDYAFDAAGESGAKMLLELLETGQSHVSKLVMGFNYISRATCP
ncbi:LacI family DNA-binding transcriptional regulator [Salinivibrio sp. VYel1]|uniref:LacI family DNA-binding transcriptional regulator n=1 Tax=Salinivibrio sp. VYel1 TaxID=2490490 RepID=UPI00128C67D6|nr:LacI family DNA-binding transcriptional regulator [Salinivibrio sp. VYel1]MPX89443.1 LacI family transcriptional regulator [Salinivibrio sp. VYel1]